jgi:hypothetical protein
LGLLFLGDPPLLVTAFDDDPYLSLDDSSQRPLPVGEYDDSQKEFASPTNIRARHAAEVNLYGALDPMIGTVRDLSRKVQGDLGNSKDQSMMSESHPIASEAQLI